MSGETQSLKVCSLGRTNAYYEYITFRYVLFQVLSLILIFLFVKERDDYLIYIGITALMVVVLPRASFYVNMLIRSVRKLYR